MHDVGHANHAGHHNALMLQERLLHFLWRDV